MQTIAGDILRFGSFTLHRGRGQLIGESGPIELRPKSFALLCHFVEQAGRLLAKDELAQAVWKDGVVTDESIARCVSDIRKALGYRHRQMIRTAPGRGYLFEGVVNKVEAASLKQPAPAIIERLPSIAILPVAQFRESGKVTPSAHDDLGRGVAEDIMVRLSKIADLRIIACSPQSSGHGPIDELRAGKELGAMYVLAASLRRDGRRARVAVRLVDIGTRTQIWAERYDVALSPLLEVQDQLARQIVGTLASKLKQAEIGRALQKPTGRLDSYDNYLRGVAALGASETSDATSGAMIVKARRLLRRSLAVDPGHAPALVRLSVTFMAGWGTRRHDPRLAGEYRLGATIERALQSARHAVALAPLLAEAHAQLGWCLHCAHRRREALHVFQRALELNGGMIDGRYSLMLTHAGGHNEAIEIMQRAGKLDPRPGPFHSSFLADAHYLIGDYRTALTLSRTAADQAPAFARIRIWQAAAAARLGLVAEARRAMQAVASLDPDLTVGRYLDHVQFARPDDGRHVAAGLLAAGMPA